MAPLIKSPMLLVDADTILYRCGFAAEKTHYMVEKPDGTYRRFYSHKEAKVDLDERDYIWSRRVVEPAENALHLVKNVLKQLEEKFDSQNRILFLTGKGNFRDELAITKEYKGNRDPAHRPKHYQAIKAYLMELKAHITHGFEADDAIATGANQLDVGEYVIVSNDKDLDQIPGHHYDWTNGKEWTITPEDSMRVFYTQLLSGDTTDNIPGVMSDKKAAKVVQDCWNLSIANEVAVEAYNEKYGMFEYKEKLFEVGDLVWLKKSLVPDKPGYDSPIREYFKTIEEGQL